MKKWISLLTALLLLVMTGICAAEETVDVSDDPAESEFPELNEDGFLDSGEFVYEGEEEGLWRYASPTLKVEIRRYIQKKPKRTWYEAEIWCAEGIEVPHMIMNDPEHWKTNREYPYKIARKNGTVIAISSDYAQNRMLNKQRVGIVIRNGEILSDRTKAKGAKGFPNLDCLAIYPDGDMKVFDSDEMTAEEYLEDGAVDVLSFGPWLIRDGELNEDGIKKYGTSHAQRTAVGMVEKGHYFFMMLEGRINRSNGDGIGFLAEKLQARGCTVAFNLDGGQTSCIVFMGHQLCKIEEKRRQSSRATSDILGVGTSDLLPAVKDPW